MSGFVGKFFEIFFKRYQFLIPLHDIVIIAAEKDVEKFFEKLFKTYQNMSSLTDIIIIAVKKDVEKFFWKIFLKPCKNCKV